MLQQLARHCDVLDREADGFEECDFVVRLPSGVSSGNDIGQVTHRVPGNEPFIQRSNKFPSFDSTLLDAVAHDRSGAANRFPVDLGLLKKVAADGVDVSSLSEIRSVEHWSLL